MSDNSKSITVSLLGPIGTVLAIVLLCAFGACGKSCQACTLNGITQVRTAVTGDAGQTK